MRLRVCVLACALAVLGSLAAAGMASAASRQDHRVTIVATPDPSIAGEGVLIYGRLLGSDNGGRAIRLYHHMSGRGQGYTFVTMTLTDPAGYYEFPRPEGLVFTNRDWYIRGPDNVRSRTIHEHVMALVTIGASRTTTDTSHRILFSGHVTPSHRFEQVFLQRRIGSGDDWRTLRATTLDRSSNYFVAYRWRRPGIRDVRVLFRGDGRNARGSSDVLTVDVEQAQMPGFTINSSEPIVPAGSSVTIFGVLDQPGTSSPDEGATVELWGRTSDHTFQMLGTEVTRPDGSYSFTQTGLSTNTIYEVTTAPGTQSPDRHTALLYQGVRDVVTMQSRSGQPVTFTGTVQPDKSGRVISLQSFGRDGEWHTVELAIVQQGSTFQFTVPQGAPGQSTFRARITSDENNVGSVSPPVTITSSAPPASTLPQGS